MICKNCGRACIEGEKFCPECGMKLEAEPIKPTILVGDEDRMATENQCLTLSIIGVVLTVINFGGSFIGGAGLVLSIVAFCLINQRKKTYGKLEGNMQFAWVFSIIGMSIGGAGVVFSIIGTIFSCIVTSYAKSILSGLFEKLIPSLSGAVI